MEHMSSTQENLPKGSSILEFFPIRHPPQDLYNIYVPVARYGPYYIYLTPFIDGRIVATKKVTTISEERLETRTSFKLFEVPVPMTYDNYVEVITSCSLKPVNRYHYIEKLLHKSKYGIHFMEVEIYKNDVLKGKQAFFLTPPESILELDTAEYIYAADRSRRIPNNHPFGIPHIAKIVSQ